MTTQSVSSSRRDWLTIGLWIAQILLALMFGAAGVMKAFQPIEALAPAMSFVSSTPEWLVRFIGVAEIAGALGMILPALTRIMPVLLPLAAVGFAVIQVLAIGVHAALGETASTLPVNLVLLALSLFVAWGRFRARPVRAR